MTRLMALFGLVASLLLALFVAACGQVSSSHGSADTQGAATQTVQAGTAAQTTSGKVTLSLPKQRYGVEEPLLVTIHNGLQMDIMLTDGGAGCVSIEVERLAQNTWQSVSQCAPAPAGRKVVVISAGNAFVQRIEFAREMDSGAGWSAGIYRVRLTYSPSENGANPGATGAPVYSAEFTIG
jgi:hypothetical protein